MGHQLIGGMINGVAQPVLVQVMDDKERQVLVFRKMVRFGAFVSFPAMLGLAFVAKEFVLILLGEKWLDSVPFLQLFCLWGAMGYLSQLYVNLLMAHSRSEVYLLGMILIGLLQILVVWILYPFGVFNMVIGYICVYFFSILFWHYSVKEELPIKLISICKDIAPYLMISLFVFGMVNYMLITISNIYALLILKILLSFILYILILFLLRSTILIESMSYLKRK